MTYIYFNINFLIIYKILNSLLIKLLLFIKDYLFINI